MNTVYIVRDWSLLAALTSAGFKADFLLPEKKNVKLDLMFQVRVD